MTGFELYTFEDEIALAVSGWVQELQHPAQVDIGEITVPLVIGQMIAGLTPLTSEDLREFTGNLYHLLQKRVQKVRVPKYSVELGLEMFGERFYEINQPWCSLISDYGPIGLLANAAGHIRNTMLRFPARTMISIWPKRVVLYRGYGSPAMQTYRLVKPDK